MFSSPAFAQTARAAAETSGGGTLFFVGQFVLIGLITVALRITIKRDRATIKADMDDPEDIDAYKKRWGSPQ